MGQGHVIVHNQISGYASAVNNYQTGARSFDVNNNEVLWTYNCGVKLSLAEGNVRAIRNRFTNVFMGMAVQPIYGGPAYFLRNVVVNPANEQMKFHALGGALDSDPNGILVYNNTFVSPYNALTLQTPAVSHHFAIENNLFVGPRAESRDVTVDWEGSIDDGLFDYNGYFPDDIFAFVRLNLPKINVPNFAALQAVGWEPHGVLLREPIFASGLVGPVSHVALMPPQDVTLAANSPALDRGVVLPNVSDAWTGTAPDLGALESGCPAPIYGPRPIGIDETNEPFGCSGNPPPTPPPPAVPTGTASFIKTDMTTQGSWRSAYGSDGYNVVNDTANYPAYVKVTPSDNSSYVWAQSTSDVRAMQRILTNDRTAACWYSSGSFSVDLNFTDSNIHQVAFYMLDWDNYLGRTQRIDILDANNTVLDTRTISSFTGGQYLVWNLNGHVVVRFTNMNNQSNAVLSGILFGSGGSAPAGSGTAVFLKNDVTTQGRWKGVYGAEGYNVIGDSASSPAYVNVIPAGNSYYLWTGATNDQRAPQKVSSNEGVAACLYSGTSFTLDLAFSDSNVHQVALYLLDWDNYFSRTERVDILDTNNNLLDSRPVSSFTGGQYLVWNLSGHVIVRIVNTNPSSNAVLSGIFFR
jgi:hypothetical protein